MAGKLHPENLGSPKKWYEPGRDLTKGEKAMGLAFLYPEPEKDGRG
jgi:hypothetical protein